MSVTSSLIAAFALSLSPLTQAQTPMSWQGVYTCSVEGRERVVNVEMQNGDLVVQGLAVSAGLTGPMPCTNQRLTKTQGGAVYTFVSECGDDGIYRALILDRPDSLEQFSLSTHIQPISASELDIHVQIKFTGTVDQDLAVKCWK